MMTIIISSWDDHHILIKSGVPPRGHNGVSGMSRTIIIIIIVIVIVITVIVIIIIVIFLTSLCFLMVGNRLRVENCNLYKSVFLNILGGLPDWANLAKDLWHKMRKLESR